jgi:predicted RNA-binding protein with PUA-like domain
VFRERFKRTIPLSELRAIPALDTMAVLQKGQRLSVMPVGETEWQIVNALPDLR